MSRWPASVKIGTRATCRTCGKLAVFGEDMSEWEWDAIPEHAKESETRTARHSQDGFVLKWEYQNKGWEHADGTRRCPADGSMINPAEICTELGQSTGNMCGRKVSPENLAAGIHACGTHAKKVVERIKAKEEEARRRASMDERYALLRWEHDEQLKAWEWLKAAGLGDALSAERAFDKYDRDYRSFRDSNTSFDPIALREMIEDNFTRKAPGVDDPSDS